MEIFYKKILHYFNSMLYRFQFWILKLKFTNQINDFDM